jgi:hypothetical protein
MTSLVAEGSAHTEELVSQDIVSQDVKETASPEESKLLLAEIKGIVSDNLKLLSTLFMLQNTLAQNRCVSCNGGHTGLKKVLKEHFVDSDDEGVEEGSGKMEMDSKPAKENSSAEVAQNVKGQSSSGNVEAVKSLSGSGQEVDEDVDESHHMHIEIQEGMNPERFIAGIQGKIAMLPQIAVSERLQGVLSCVKAEREKLSELEKKIDSLFIMRCDKCVKEREDSRKEHFGKLFI